MESIINDFQDNWHIYLSMPLIGALIGYLTKLVAVQMLLRPLEFKGIKPIFGWQGIIPRYAGRMAEIAVDLMLARLLDPQEIIDRIDPQELASRMQEPLGDVANDVTRTIMKKYKPGIWEAMPEFTRALIIGRIQQKIPKIIDRTVADLRTDVNSVIDLKTVAVTALTRDKALLVRLVKQVGNNELKFIIKVGAPFGFFLGLVQMVAWALTKNVWVVPIFGALTGYFTDWLALQMVFRPIKEKRYIFFKWQGLFHKRRAEVSNDYADLMAQEILTPSNIIEGVLAGPNVDKLLDLVVREVTQELDDQIGLLKPLFVFAIGGREYQEMVQDIADLTIGHIRRMSGDVKEFAMDAVGVNQLMAEKMNLMTDEEYEGLLRPAFKQDEWKLVSVGAVLGFLVGELQVHLLLQ